MIIDERRHVRLGVPENEAAIRAAESDSSSPYAPGNRQLLLHDTPIFDLPWWCGTCPSVFERVGEVDRGSVDHVHEVLNDGLEAIDDAVLAVCSRVLPEGRFTVLLLDIEPVRAERGDPHDYFGNELLTTWSREELANKSIGDPYVPHYRTFETDVDGDEHLYELVLPLLPDERLDSSRVAAYVDRPERTRTAVAFSLLDVCTPAIDDYSVDYHAHALLARFLLDGHHKVAASARRLQPIRLLAFLDEDRSVARPEDISEVLAARRRTRRRRGA